MRLLRISLAGTCCAVAALAAAATEVPLPIKKPKDATGAPLVGNKSEPARPAVETAKPADKTETPNIKSAVPAPGGTPASEAAKSAATDQKPEVPPAKDAEKPDAPAAETDDKPSDGKPAETKPAEATEWPPLEIELAKARCTNILRGLDVVAVPEAPFRKGECGSAAPMRLISIGKSPEVTLSPPAIVSCDMVVSLYTWMTRDLQPLARKHLGSDIIKIESMSDYSCRNAYGRTTTKLSEHGRANALDIRGFVTAKAEQAYVLEGWGPTQRDIAAQIAAAKAAAEKAVAEKEKAGAERAAKEAAEKAVGDGKSADAKVSSATQDETKPETSIRRSTIVEGIPQSEPSEANGKRGAEPSLGFKPNQLGGPKESKAKVSRHEGAADPEPVPPEPGKAEPGKPNAAKIDAVPLDPGLVARPIGRMGKFLREAHDSACRIFGTTLGPETNEAHRNHFHVDMAPRKHSNICE